MFSQRQIEVGTLLELYRGCVTNVIANMKKDLASNHENERAVFCCMVDMLSTLISLSDDDYVARVKCVLVQNFILECILDAMEKIEVSFCGMILILFSRTRLLNYLLSYNMG